METPESYRESIRALVVDIVPGDALERSHIDIALAWIASGAPLCRIAKHATPPQHLVAYVAVVDTARRQLVLVDHRKADLWLPTGGHVEPEEAPDLTARREVREELLLDAVFVLPSPLFVTVTETVGSTAGHTDVSLWYVVQGDSAQPLRFDQEEFRDARWFALSDLPLERTDPHLARFVTKLRATLF